MPHSDVSSQVIQEKCFLGEELISRTDSWLIEEIIRISNIPDIKVILGGVNDPNKGQVPGVLGNKILTKT